MKASKLRELTNEELSKEDQDLREQLFKLRFQSATGQSESAGRMKSVRRDIARVQTLLREMEISKEKAQP